MRRDDGSLPPSWSLKSPLLLLLLLLITIAVISARTNRNRPTDLSLPPFSLSSLPTLLPHIFFATMCFSSPSPSVPFSLSLRLPSLATRVRFVRGGRGGEGRREWKEERKGALRTHLHHLPFRFLPLPDLFPPTPPPHPKRVPLLSFPQTKQQAWEKRKKECEEEEGKEEKESKGEIEARGGQPPVYYCTYVGEEEKGAGRDERGKRRPPPRSLLLPPSLPSKATLFISLSSSLRFYESHPLLPSPFLL